MAPVASLSLNCDDLTEAKYYARLSLKSRKKNSKSREKNVALPVVSEISNEEDDEENAQTSWCCHACTFQNNVHLSLCEMCNTERGKAAAQAALGTVVEATTVPSIGSVPNQDWPSLPEAWIHCDTSSVASSWLDIGNATDLAGMDVDADIVLVGDATVAAPAKPMLWSAVVGRNATAVAAPVVPAGLPRKPAVRTSTKAPKEEDTTDDALDLLEDRRIQGTGQGRMKKR